MGLIRNWQRRRQRRQPFPPAWERILAGSFPPYGRRPDDDLAALRGQIQVFLAEKVFEGCNGQVIDDQMDYFVLPFEQAACDEGDDVSDQRPLPFQVTEGGVGGVGAERTQKRDGPQVVKHPFPVAAREAAGEASGKVTG